MEAGRCGDSNFIRNLKEDKNPDYSKANIKNFLHVAINNDNGHCIEALAQDERARPCIEKLVTGKLLCLIAGLNKPRILEILLVINPQHINHVTYYKYGSPGGECVFVKDSQCANIGTSILSYVRMLHRQDPQYGEVMRFLKLYGAEEFITTVDFTIYKGKIKYTKKNDSMNIRT